jgi:hypothetical protein
MLSTVAPRNFQALNNVDDFLAAERDHCEADIGEAKVYILTPTPACRAEEGTVSGERTCRFQVGTNLETVRFPCRTLKNFVLSSPQANYTYRSAGAGRRC